jgi:hypothetical protein
VTSYCKTTTATKILPEGGHGENDGRRSEVETHEGGKRERERRD